MQRPYVIIVTGTPGTGKTTIAQVLADTTGFLYMDGKKIIHDHDLAESYDTERQCHIIDQKRFLDTLINMINAYHTEEGLIIDSHLAHEIPPDYADLVIVTTCNRKILKRRMEERGYSEEKINENIEAEIFDTCTIEAQESGHKKIEKVDTTSSIKEQLDRIVQQIK